MELDSMLRFRVMVPRHGGIGRFIIMIDTYSMASQLTYYQLLSSEWRRVFIFILDPKLQGLKSTV